MLVVRFAHACYAINVRAFSTIKEVLFVRFEPMLLFGAVTATYAAVSMSAAPAGQDVLVLNLVAAIGLPLFGSVCAMASRQRSLARSRLTR